MTKRTLSDEGKEVIQNKVAQNPNVSGPYNIGKWSDDEHERFLEAIKIYGNLWKKVRDCVGTRSCAQIRSHCQKFFRRKRNMKIQELRKTNRLKGMVFLVIEEYYNYANSSSRHTDTSFGSRPTVTKPINCENKAGLKSPKTPPETPSYDDPGILISNDFPGEPNDLSLEIICNEEILPIGADVHENNLQFNEPESYQQENDLSVNNPYYELYPY